MPPEVHLHLGFRQVCVTGVTHLQLFNSSMVLVLGLGLAQMRRTKLTQFIHSNPPFGVYLNTW